MAEVKKYLFDTSFHDATGSVIIPAEVAAKEQGFGEGHSAGHQQALEEIEEQTRQTLTSIDVQLKTIAADQQNAYQYLNHHVMTLTDAIANKIIPRLIQQGAEEEVRAFVEEALRFIKQEGDLTIWAASSVAEPIRQHLTQISQSGAYPFSLQVKEDDALDATSVRIEWQDGGIRHCTKEIWQSIESAIETYKQACPTPPVEDQVEEQITQSEEVQEPQQEVTEEVQDDISG
ncbi:MAG: hypothetical protein ACPGXY_01780 [Alphaproteobacteria bacterium]